MYTLYISQPISFPCIPTSAVSSHPRFALHVGYPWIVGSTYDEFVGFVSNFLKIVSHLEDPKVQGK